MKISHIQDSFAHIVGNMRDSLLFQRDDAGPEIIAIVRLRPRKGRSLYFDALVRLFFAIFAMLMATFAWLTLFVSTAVVILSFFSWLPIAQLDEMLQRPAPQDLLLFFAIPQGTLNRLEIFFELESALALILIVGALLLLMKEAGNFRWLLIFSRQFASQLPPEPIRKMMRISTPSSVDYEIIEEPSLTMVLDVVQRNHSVRFSEDVAIFALNRFSARDGSAVQVVVTLSNQVAITLQGRDGKQETLIIVENSKNSGWARLIDYLCEQQRGEWIARDTLLSDVYHGVSDAKKSLLFRHRQRINDRIEGMAERAGLPLPYDGKEMTLLFEFRRNNVRLSPACEVVRYPKLTALHGQVEGLHTGIVSRATLPTEELIRRCDEVASEYGNGYLAEHYNRGYLAEHRGTFGIWEWAREPYIKYRDMWFAILEYVMRRLRDYAEQSDLTSDERADSTRQVAKCFGRYALAAIGIIPKVEESAQALHRCVGLYRDLMDDKAAEDILQEYVDRLEQRPDFWQLPPAAEQILNEATALLEQFYHTRKKQKAHHSSGQRGRRTGS